MEIIHNDYADGVLKSDVLAEIPIFKEDVLRSERLEKTFLVPETPAVPVGASIEWMLKVRGRMAFLPPIAESYSIGTVKLPD